MKAKARVFLDTSAIFSGIFSAEGGARALLLLGEARVISLLTSRYVFKELEVVVKKKAAESLPTLALLLNEAHIELVDDGNKRTVKRLVRLLGSLGDAEVMSGALISQPDFFVTHDKKHFLKNAKIQAQIPFQIGTPGDCLNWLRPRFE